MASLPEERAFIAIQSDRQPMQTAVHPESLADALAEHWSPRVVAEFDDYYVKVAKLKGQLVWHSHDHEDELFLVLKGRLRIELETGTVELGPGQLYVVANGVRHNPVAEDECLILLIEHKTTAHTGSEITAATRSLADQLRPLPA